MQTHVNAGCMMHLSFHVAVYHHLKSRAYTAAVIRPRCLYRQTFLTISDLRRFPTKIPVWNFGIRNFTCPVERYILVASVGYCSLDFEQLSFARKSVSERILAAKSRELRGRKFATCATLLLKYCRLKIFEQKRDCSKSNRSWKRDIKERHWGQELRQMERDISVWLSEMTRPVKVDHHQSWGTYHLTEKSGWGVESIMA